MIKPLFGHKCVVWYWAILCFNSIAFFIVYSVILSHCCSWPIDNSGFSSFINNSFDRFSELRRGISAKPLNFHHYSRRSVWQNSFNSSTHVSLTFSFVLLSWVSPPNLSHIAFPFLRFSDVSLVPEVSVSQKSILWHFYLDIRVHCICQKQYLPKEGDLRYKNVFFVWCRDQSPTLLINSFFGVFFRDWTRDNHNRPQEVPVWTERALRSGGFRQQQWHKVIRPR